MSTEEAPVLIPGPNLVNKVLYIGSGLGVVGSAPEEISLLWVLGLIS